LILELTFQLLQAMIVQYQRHCSCDGWTQQHLYDVGFHPKFQGLLSKLLCLNQAKDEACDHTTLLEVESLEQGSYKA
jgi:hypothetical protein